MGRLSLILLLCLAAGLASARVMIPRELRMPNQYVEIVREKPKPCTADCFVEYFLLSNGVMIRKHLDTPDYDDAIPVFSARRVAFEGVDAILEKTAAFLGKPKPETGGHTDPHNIYYYDGDTHHAWSAKEPAPEFTAIFDKFAAAFSEGKLAEDFYLHVYYQPIQGGTQALHIFSDGTIVSSVFDKFSYRMTGTSISRVMDADLATAKKLAAAAQASAGKYFKCDAATGIEYGVVEYVHGGTIAKNYTCGTGSGEIPALFNLVRGFGSD